MRPAALEAVIIHAHTHAHGPRTLHRAATGHPHYLWAQDARSAPQTSHARSSAGFRSAAARRELIQELILGPQSEGGLH